MDFILPVHQSQAHDLEWFACQDNCHPITPDRLFMTETHIIQVYEDHCLTWDISLMARTTDPQPQDASGSLQDSF